MCGLPRSHICCGLRGVEGHSFGRKTPHLSQNLIVHPTLVTAASGGEHEPPELWVIEASWQDQLGPTAEENRFLQPRVQQCRSSFFLAQTRSFSTENGSFEVPAPPNSRLSPEI